MAQARITVLPERGLVLPESTDRRQELVRKLRVHFNRKNRPSFQERGSTGTENISGFLTSEEYNTALQGLNGIKIYDQMRRSDAQVHATLMVLTLPIQSATYTFKPASESPKDLEISEFVEKCYFEYMSIPWKSHLQQALLFLPFGFMVFEKCYRYHMGERKYVLDKLAPRLPKTIYRWIQHETGTLDSIIQYAWFPHAGNPQNSVMNVHPSLTRGANWGQETFGTWKYQKIDGDKLIVLTHNREGDNFEGISILRSAYQNYFYKSLLYKISAMKHERYSAGIPVIHMPENYDEEDISYAEEVAMSLRSHEKSYAILPPRYEMEILGQGSSVGSDVMSDIVHHNEMISASMLAQYMDLGKRGVGSNSQSNNMTDILFLSEQSKADYFQEVHNREVIPELVDMNFEKPDEYPKLDVGDIRPLDYAAVAEALNGMAQSKVLTPDAKIEEWVRKEFGFPEADGKLPSAQERVTPIAPALPNTPGLKPAKPPVLPGKKPPARNMKMFERKGRFMVRRKLQVVR